MGGHEAGTPLFHLLLAERSRPELAELSQALAPLFGLSVVRMRQVLRYARGWIARDVEGPLADAIERALAARGVDLHRIAASELPPRAPLTTLKSIQLEGETLRARLPFVEEVIPISEISYVDLMAAEIPSPPPLTPKQTSRRQREIEEATRHESLVRQARTLADALLLGAGDEIGRMVAEKRGKLREFRAQAEVELYLYVRYPRAILTLAYGTPILGLPESAGSAWSDRFLALLGILQKRLPSHTFTMEADSFWSEMSGASILYSKGEERENRIAWLAALLEMRAPVGANSNRDR